MDIPCPDVQDANGKSAEEREGIGPCCFTAYEFGGKRRLAVCVLVVQPLLLQGKGAGNFYCLFTFTAVNPPAGASPISVSP